jgi:hypothetical protein
MRVIPSSERAACFAPTVFLAEQLRRQLLLFNELCVHGTDYSDDIGHHLSLSVTPDQIHRQ